jgi:hypothetical protein
LERRPDRAPASPVAAAAASFLRTSVRLTMTRRFLAASCAPQPRATFSFAVGIQPLFAFGLGVAAPSSQGLGRSWQLGAPGDTESGDYKNPLSTRIAQRGFAKFPPVFCTFRVESGQVELDPERSRTGALQCSQSAGKVARCWALRPSPEWDLAWTRSGLCGQGVPTLQLRGGDGCGAGPLGWLS